MSEQQKGGRPQARQESEAAREARQEEGKPVEQVEQVESAASKEKSPADPRVPVSVHATEVVAKFHDAFGHPVERKPAIPSREQRMLRVRLIGEELAELARASGIGLEVRVGYGRDLDGVRVRHDENNMPPDLIEAADALGDLDVVVAGSYLVWGVPGFAVLSEVHESNMTKLGPNGEPIYDEGGKVLKGPKYRPPNIRAVLIAAGWSPPARS